MALGGTLSLGGGLVETEPHPAKGASPLPECKCAEE